MSTVIGASAISKMNIVATICGTLFAKKIDKPVCKVFLWYTLMPVSPLQCYLDLLQNLTQYLIVKLNMNINKY